ncbi:hypothetical protein [Pseudactinotalea terrae]|uniref:hypothetical protein n=1 Tax=Pseudactinotalea terrae TaxID=1743262 RepID=UPI0012E22C3C|nr:hypothetical protein [Pseudactinotalea terrae]
MELPTLFPPVPHPRRSRHGPDHAGQPGHYLDHPDRDLNRIHVFRQGQQWATFIPSWRPEAFEDDGHTLRPPYGVVVHETRAAAQEYVRAHLAGPEHAADLAEVDRLRELGGPGYVRRLTDADRHAGRVRLEDITAAAAWNRLMRL